MSRTTAVAGVLISFLALHPTSALRAEPLPASTSPQFCVEVQKVLAGTTMVGENTVFADMPSYRHSKPAVQPLKIYQVATYAGKMPIVVSCKMKTSGHLREVYGARAAGQQLFCPDIARMLQQQTVDELTSAGQAEAAQRAAAFVIDPDVPFVTGREYLTDFRTIYRGADGAVHVSSPGLYQDPESWYTWLLPEILKGQSYCHLATVEYLKAVATGAMEPGTVITTADDAPTTPR
ncbi:MAG: hypothetical protein SFV19_06015 [Rhodospirillaceae bacterium]|nr:hypothetical protein [Rhodospirillaceae bacterium]